jgi:hypothetical protein
MTFISLDLAVTISAPRESLTRKEKYTTTEWSSCTIVHKRGATEDYLGLKRIPILYFREKRKVSENEQVFAKVFVSAKIFVLANLFWRNIFVFAKFSAKKLWRILIKIILFTKNYHFRKSFRQNFRFRESFRTNFCCHESFRINFRVCENIRYFRNFS